eukprot:705270-Prorocentrum_lima.AAC.1
MAGIDETRGTSSPGGEYSSSTSYLWPPNTRKHEAETDGWPDGGEASSSVGRRGDKSGAEF